MAGSESVKLLATFALIVSICGCEKAPQEHLADARGDLADTVYDEAIAAAQAGLLANPDAATSWGLELVMLEAHGLDLPARPIHPFICGRVRRRDPLVVLVRAQ